MWFISDNSFLNVWCKWDAQWYLEIATNGYAFDPNSYAFFPLYPLCIRFLSSIFGNPELMGLIISNISLLVAVYFLYKLIELKWSDLLAKNTILLLILFPTAFFFSAIYTESLFLALVVLSFYFAEKKNYMAAGIFGMFASATRLIGLIMVPCLLVKYLFERKWKLKKLDYNVVYMLIIPIGLLVYMLYLYLSTGDPLAFIHAQSSIEFKRYITIPFIPIYENFIQIFSKTFNSIYILNTIITLVFIIVIIYNWKKMPLEYNVYSSLSLLIPLSTIIINDPLHSLSRFAILIFPVFISIGMLEIRPFIRNCLFMILFACQVLLMINFVNWHWVA